MEGKILLTPVLLKNFTSSKEFNGAVYRTYSEIDIFDLLNIKIAIIKREGINFINQSTFLSSYEGHTIFSIYLNNYDVFQKILNQLSETEFENEISYRKKVLENNATRRLYRILKMPTMDFKTSNQCIDCEKA